MKAIVVHRGPRDAYQAAIALYKSGMLDRLVTDLYWPADTRIARAASRLLPTGITDTLRKRCATELPAHKVDSAFGNGLCTQVLEKAPVPFRWRQAATRRTDSLLGTRAAAMAARNGSALVAYSYYASSAFQSAAAGTPRILFQLHPHPASVRAILQAEFQAHPECEASLRKEWELSLPEEDFQRLCGEAHQAHHCLCASSFTRRTLIDNGIPAERIHVIPYGVDLQRFSPALAAPRASTDPLRLLFVGTINQRKGIKYLLDALRSLDKSGLLRDRIELRVCGRVVDDLSLFSDFGNSVRVTPSVSHAELVQAYRSADLFVFPSVAEGFAQVLLESLACGLPILSTTSTAAPDLITQGDEGWVVKPRDVEAIASRIRWALSNRAELHSMRRAARRRAETFTWQRFRESLAAKVKECLEPAPASTLATSTLAVGNG